MRDGWIYQGRQYHMWFGHGTKPKGTLDDRIHDVGHAFIAALPASKRSEPAAQLSADDHGRLDRVLAGVVQALPLGLRLIPLRVLGTSPDAPGIGEFIAAGSLLKSASTQVDLREATDLVARSAEQMGIGRFKPFLRTADDHLARSGGMVALVRDMRPAPSLKVPAIPGPRGPRLPPPGQLAPLIGRALWGAGLLALGIALDALIRANREAQIRAALERFQLDPSKPADAAAALAYVWARVNRALLLGTSLPESAQDAVAARVMRSAQADPTLLDRAISGDAKALAAIREAVQSVELGFAIETQSDEERDLVSQMQAQGRSGSEIQAALDQRRANTTPRTAEERRNSPGTVIMSIPLAHIEGQWLSSNHSSEKGAPIPRQVADRLIGRYFENFRAFREEFWKTVAAIPGLARQFNSRNLAAMRNGHAPFAPQPVAGGRAGVWELHHDPEIGKGGAVYDLSNITIMMPHQHDMFHRQRRQ